MISNLERHTLAFLKDWLKWATTGAVWHPIYRKEQGLCLSYQEYARHTPFTYSELSKLFRAQGLNTGFPFGEKEFWEDARNATMHTNPMRLEWVRKTIKQLENKQ